MLNLTPVMGVMVPLIVAVFTSSGLWSFLLYIAQKRDQKQDIRTRAELVLLHDAVYNNCQKAIHRGYTTFMEFDNICELYAVYSEMGGNGTGKQLYDKVCKLPIKEHIEEFEEEEQDDNKRNDTVS